MGMFDGLLGVAGGLLGGAVGGPTGAAIGSSLGSGLGGYLGQDATNRENRQAAEAQMSFQERMANTSYQRAVKDMEAAGLNPMLAYSQGGAASPTGATYTAGNKYSAGQAAADAAAELKLKQQKHTINRPDEIKGELADKAYRAVTDSVLPKVGDILEKVVTAVTKKEQDPAPSAAAEVRKVQGPKDAHAERVEKYEDWIKAKQNSAAGVVRRFKDAHERAKEIIADEKSASSMPSAREQARASGRRLGTLLRQPRYVPSEDGRADYFSIFP